VLLAILLAGFNSFLLLALNRRVGHRARNLSPAVRRSLAKEIVTDDVCYDLYPFGN